MSNSSLKQINDTVIVRELGQSIGNFEGEPMEFHNSLIRAEICHMDPSNHIGTNLSPTSLHDEGIQSHTNLSQPKNVRSRKLALELDTIDAHEIQSSMMNTNTTTIIEEDTNHILNDEHSISSHQTPRLVQSRVQYYGRCSSKCHLLLSNIPSRYIPYSVGRFIILCPVIYRMSSKGIVGPHWYGVIVAYFILFYASYNFIPASWNQIGPLSGMICILFTLITSLALLLTSCTDPGIVQPMKLKRQKRNTFLRRYELLQVDDEEDLDVEDQEECNMIFEDMKNRDWRYCGTCDVFQPPGKDTGCFFLVCNWKEFNCNCLPLGAVHCPFCQVCIEGYDHHCPWYVF